MEPSTPLDLWVGPGEFGCRCGSPHCYALTLDRRLAKADAELRAKAPVGSFGPITSGYRCKIHNQCVGGHPASRHMQGRALDRRVPGVTLADAFEIAKDIPGITGIGVYLGHNHHPFVHIEIGGDASELRTWGRLDGKRCSMNRVFRAEEERSK